MEGESIIPIWFREEFTKLPERREPILEWWMKEMDAEEKKEKKKDEKFADCESTFGGTLTKESIFVTPKSDISKDFSICGIKYDIKLTKENIEKKMKDFEDNDRSFKEKYKNVPYNELEKDYCEFKKKMGRISKKGLRSRENKSKCLGK